MVRQTQMNGAGHSNGKTSGIGNRVAAFGVDVIELIELQFRLFVADLREAKTRLRGAVMMLLLGPVIVLGALSSLIWGIAAMLIQWAGWSEPAAFLTVGFLTLLFASGLTWMGVKRLITSMNIATRSRSELTENIRWVKSALAQRASPTSSQTDS